MSRSPSFAPASNNGRRSSTNRPAKGLRITAMPTAHTTDRDAGTPSSERTISRMVMILRMSTIASSLLTPHNLLDPAALRDPGRKLVDLVYLVDVVLLKRGQARVVRAGATARQRRCSSPVKEQRFSQPIS